MKPSRILFALLVISTLVSTDAIAGRTWYYNQVEFSNGTPAPIGNIAIAMRSGNTWPVVAYSDGVQSGVATMVPGTWVNSAGGFTGQYIDAATASDGTIAFADDRGNIKMLTKTGFTSAYYGGSTMDRKPSIAFNNSNTLGVLHNGFGGNELSLTTKTGNTWNTSRVEDSMLGPIFSSSFALDFDSYNQANIVFEDGGHLRFGTKGALTQNQWVFSSWNPDNPFVNGAMDMELTNNDIPFVVYSDGMFLKYSTYDIQRDKWSTGILDAFSGLSNNFCIASDSAGGIGVAYVTQLGGVNMLSYAYNDGSGWMGTERLLEADSSKTVGLTFDYQNNPVISYGQGGFTYIAYDPVVTPEPASLVLLTFGAVLFRRRA